MKVYTLPILLGLMLCLVSSQNIPSGGAGGFSTTISCIDDYTLNETTKDCELNMTSYTGCLVQNCDTFCKQREMDYGRFYKDSKCWCEGYIDSKHGRLIGNDGWIEIKECFIDKNNRIKENSCVPLWLYIVGLIAFLIMGICIGRISKGDSQCQ